jgi:hypothetical protein
MDIVAIANHMRFANAFDANHQVFNQPFTNSTACVDMCAANVFCAAVYMASCSNQVAGVCIGLNAAASLVYDPFDNSASLVKRVSTPMIMLLIVV